MRVSMVVLALSMLIGLVPAAPMQEAKAADYKGIWVSTPFPSFTISPGETITLDLTVRNAGLPPQRITLGLDRLPAGWSAVFLGKGERVQSVFVAPNDKASVKLRLEPSGKASERSLRFDVLARGTASRFRLPIEVNFGESLPPKLTLKPELPDLRGSPTSDFEFKVAIHNEGGDDAMVRVDANVAQGFRAKITEQYGSQELTSLPLKTGEEKTVTIKITPPFGVKQGKYPVDVRVTSGKAQAHTRLMMEVTGEPKLELTGSDERLNAFAEAGEESPIELVLANDGSAPAQGIKLNATSPTGWKVTFRPETIDSLAPDAKETIRALVTPSSKAIAGDYMVTMRAEAGEANKSSDFRVTVRTSTLWGLVGVLVIAAALVVLVIAMLKYGRR